MLADSEGAVVYESLTAPFGIDLDGATLATTEAVENADYAYTTKERDRETGLVYFGKRFYSPSMGRWLTPDPKFRDDPQEVVQHPLEGNLYSYVRNSPMGYVDPTGFGAWAMTGGAYDVFSGVPDSWYRYGGGVLDLPANLLNGAINVVGSATSGVDTALGSAGTNLEEIGISMMMIPGAGAAVGGALKYASAWAGAQSSALASRMGNVLTGSGPGRVFWSGGVGARSAAESFAMTTGGQTLEMTRVGRLLDAVTTSKTYPYVKPLWNKASQMFARGAEGAVDVFQSSKGVRLESVWGTVEYPELMKQGATINYHLAP
jgi:RHS repeat-associated protein